MTQGKIIVALACLAALLVVSTALIFSSTYDSTESSNRFSGSASLEPVFDEPEYFVSEEVDECSSGIDMDFDFVDDSCDNCLDAYNPFQEDRDFDGIGDECDRSARRSSSGSSSCNADSDCNDSNNFTFDSCVNPGSKNSYCSNVPISCTYDVDCGVSGFVGDLFCSVDNNVARIFRSFACLNPGTLISSCVYTDNQQTVNMCAGGCASGQCLIPSGFVCGNLVVESGEQCDDGNLVNGDGCSSSCTTEGITPPPPSGPVCGNNIVETGEQCDDGNTVGSDGCTYHCQSETPSPQCTPGQVQACGATPNYGMCHQGTQTCNANGFWDACTGTVYPQPEACDGIDNDCDGQADDGGACGTNPPPTPQCNDGVDNDGDSFTDYPADRGCDSINDNSEFPVNFPPTVKQCDDGIDNDGDGLVDYPTDGGCDDRLDNSESS